MKKELLQIRINEELLNQLKEFSPDWQKHAQLPEEALVT